MEMYHLTPLRHGEFSYEKKEPTGGLLLAARGSFATRRSHSRRRPASLKMRKSKKPQRKLYVAAWELPIPEMENAILTLPGNNH